MNYLVIVDMQNDFITGSLGTMEAITARNNLVQRLKSLNPQDTTLIFTRDTHDTHYLGTREGINLPIEHCIKDTPGWKLDEEVLKSSAPFGSDLVTKSTFGAWDLPYVIKADEGFNEETDSIELCGLCTDICVVSNALLLRAAMPEASIRVDASCCAGTTPANHYHALMVMRSCQIDVYESVKEAKKEN